MMDEESDHTRIIDLTEFDLTKKQRLYLSTSCDHPKYRDQFIPTNHYPRHWKDDKFSVLFEKYPLHKAYYICNCIEMIEELRENTKLMIKLAYNHFTPYTRGYAASYVFHLGFHSLLSPALRPYVFPRALIKYFEEDIDALGRLFLMYWPVPNPFDWWMTDEIYQIYHQFLERCQDEDILKKLWEKGVQSALVRIKDPEYLFAELDNEEIDDFYKRPMMLTILNSDDTPSLKVDALMKYPEFIEHHIELENIELIHRIIRIIGNKEQLERFVLDEQDRFIYLIQEMIDVYHEDEEWLKHLLSLGRYTTIYAIDYISDLDFILELGMRLDNKSVFDRLGDNLERFEEGQMKFRGPTMDEKTADYLKSKYPGLYSYFLKKLSS